MYIWSTAVLKEMGIKPCRQLKEQKKVSGFMIKRKFVIPNSDGIGISGLPLKEMVFFLDT